VASIAPSPISGRTHVKLGAKEGLVAGGLENELTVDHSGNAVVKTLTLSLDAREPHGREADYT
jgi:hypothetical protein